MPMGAPISNVSLHRLSEAPPRTRPVQRSGKVADPSAAEEPATSFLAVGRILQYDLPMRRIIGAAGAFLLVLTGLVLSPSVATAAEPEPVSTRTALSLSSNPVVAGKPAQLTVTVSSTVPGSVPVGSVALTLNGAPFAEIPLSGGTATLSFILSATGSYVFVATYFGDQNFGFSQSAAAFTVTPQPAVTTTTVTGSATTAIAGTPVALSATVSSASGTPTGTVTFLAGQNVLGTVSLVGGVAQTSATFAAGTYPISAVYNGSEGYLPSTAAVPFQVTVTAPPVPTVTSLTGSPDTAEQGSPVELTANVSALRPALARVADPEPTGTVEFFEGSTSLGTAALEDGTASLTLSDLAPGTHRITARYSGADGFSASDSEEPFTVTITAPPVPTPSRTIVSGSPDRVQVGSEVALVANVSGQPVERPAGAVARAADIPPSLPTGTVEFFADGTSIGTASLSDASAALKTSALAVGTHRITAAYRGDRAFAPSRSELAFTVVVVAKTVVPTTTPPTPKPTARPAAAPAGGKTPAGSHLATTGAAPAGSLVLGGAALLGAGLAMVLLRARRVRLSR